MCPIRNFRAGVFLLSSVSQLVLTTLFPFQVCGYGLVGESKANFQICSNCDSQCCCGQYCCPAADCSNFLQLSPHICTTCQSGCCCNDRLNDNCCPVAFCMNDKTAKSSQIQTGRACTTCQSGCCCGQTCCLRYGRRFFDCWWLI